jgi:hypothetical protein
LATITLDKTTTKERPDFFLFGEGPARIVVTIDPRFRSQFEASFDASCLSCLGEVTKTPELEVYAQADKNSPLIDLPIDRLLHTWDVELPFA